MSFHDNLAEAALRDGNTAQQFRDAAQRHANAFWFYALIGACVWYFIDWAWSLLPFALAILVAIQSVSATVVARRLDRLLAR
jgi:Flp pilus assembly protein TadB